jgi:hypothetical protein
MRYFERKRSNGDYEIIIQIEKEDFHKMKISNQDKRFFKMNSESKKISDKIGALHKLSMIYEQSIDNHED